MFDRSLYFLAFITLVCSLADDYLKPDKKLETTTPCQTCKNVANSFKKGMERTARGKHEGGDAAWEERKLGSYANSEIRLVEIQEELCNDVTKGKDQCHGWMENNEEVVEEWWRNHQKENSDFLQYFCIDKLKVCCPNNTYGIDCMPCPGGIEKPCSGNGRCKGAGTRKGSGDCKCDSGYDGELCDTCAPKFYESYKDEEKLVCSDCHKSCQEKCWEGGPKGCELCKKGWVHDPEYGCRDVDECTSQQNPPCTSDEFCINLEGSFQCVVCHKSCDGCHGDGPDMCHQCRDGYVLKEGLCIDSVVYQRSLRIQVTRYVTYLGLCVATCIVFKKNRFLAAGVAAIVAFYIAASEYSLRDEQNAGDGLGLLPKFVAPS